MTSLLASTIHEIRDHESSAPCGPCIELADDLSDVGVGFLSDFGSALAADAERLAAKVWAPNDFVFCSEVGNSVPINSLYGWFRRMLDQAGLPMIRWHDLRSSCATLLIEMGVDLVTVQRILGHRDPATTLLYIGQTPAALRGAADKIGEAMG